jgi:hypothetical protein
MLAFDFGNGAICLRHAEGCARQAQRLAAKAR